jgi:rubrerythrin
MIRVTLDGMIAAFLAIILCSVFFSWIAAEVFRRGRESRRRKHFVICGICDHVYEDPSEEELSECPQCGAMNEREKIVEI